jgi:hypothetical protein
MTRASEPPTKWRRLKIRLWKVVLMQQILFGKLPSQADSHRCRTDNIV